MGGLSIWHWLLVLLIIILVFGTKKIKNLGSDLGETVRNFKASLNGEKADSDDLESKQQDSKK